MNLRSHAPEACALAGLSYILEIGAHDEDRTRLPGSTVRSLRQMGTWAIGALGRDRTDMVSHRPLKTARLPVSPRARTSYVDWCTASTPTFANLTFGRKSFGLEDLVGLEPTVTCVDGLRIRSLGRWGHRSVIEDPGGFEPLARGLKVRSISIQV